jgi:hypothetical protein
VRCPAVDERDRQLRRALVVVQVFIYGYLAIVIGIQLYLYAHRNW